jgi:hypothetical protein
MSATQVYTHRLACNFCGLKTDITTYCEKVYRSHLPQGWTAVDRYTHDCGLTGYTRHEVLHRCPGCTADCAGETPKGAKP